MQVPFGTEGKIYLNLLNISNMPYSCSPLCLERYIEQYTSQELAYLVLRRTRAEGIQETRTKLSPALTRRFPIDNFDVTAIILIHGGRWLLTASGTSSVLYCDLDARQPVKTLLIQDQMEYLPGFQMLQVSFNLVLYLSSGNASCLFHWTFKHSITFMTQLPNQLEPKLFKCGV